MKRRLGLSLLAAGLVGGTVWFGVGGALAGSSGTLPVDITIHYSHYQPAAFTVPAGRPIAITLRTSGSSATRRRTSAIGPEPSLTTRAGRPRSRSRPSRP